MMSNVTKATAGALSQLLNKPAVKEQIAAALPKHLTPERVIRMATTVFSRNPTLQKCPLESIVGCVVQASELGLELSGPLGEAWMVPRWNHHTKQTEATFQVGYRGYFQLAYRSGKVAKIPMRTVYAGDHFSIEYGTQDRIVHSPNLGPEQGQPIGWYTCVFMKSGEVDFEFMTVAQMEAHKQKFVQKDKNGNIPPSSPWITNEEPMNWKTTARRALKRQPLSVEIQKAVTWDEYEEQGRFEHRPQLGLSRTDLVGARIGAGEAPEGSQEGEGGEEEPAGKRASKKTLGTIRGHLTRLGMTEDGLELDSYDEDAAETMLAELASRPTPQEAREREPGEDDSD
jgi:recombination protein RecT